MNAELLVYLFVLSLVSMPLFFIGLTVLISDWSRAREKRKKAAAAAKAAAESTAAESGAPPAESA